MGGSFDLSDLSSKLVRYDPHLVVVDGVQRMRGSVVREGDHPMRIIGRKITDALDVFRYQNPRCAGVISAGIEPSSCATSVFHDADMVLEVDASERVRITKNRFGQTLEA
jgi:hypothetical protein